MMQFYSGKNFIFWKPILVVLAFGIIPCTVIAQTPASGADTTIESLEALLDSTPPIKSHLELSAAIGNNPYNQLSKNTYLLVNKSFFMPEISYTHKSGLGFAVSAYDLFGNADDGWFEYDLSPSYTFDKGRDASFGVSYQKYLYSSHSPLPKSPLNNEAYTYVLVNSWWVQPGVALDYAWGKYIQKKKTVPASDFDMLLSIQHGFNFPDVLTPNGDLNLTPALNLIVGTDKFIRSFGSTKLIGRAKHIKKNAKSGAPVTAATINTYTFQQSEFLPRTIETSVDVTYKLGKFSLEGQYYFDIPMQSAQTGNYTYFLITAAVTF
jgi:hypothetical protein